MYLFGRRNKNAIIKMGNGASSWKVKSNENDNGNGDFLETLISGRHACNSAQNITD